MAYRFNALATLALSFCSCASTNFYFKPVKETSTATRTPVQVAIYPITRAENLLPESHLHLRVVGLMKLSEMASYRSLILRYQVENQTDQEMELDFNDQQIELVNSDQVHQILSLDPSHLSRPQKAQTTSQKAAPKSANFKFVPHRTTVVDVAFPLPSQINGIKSISSFKLAWKLRTSQGNANNTSQFNLAQTSEELTLPLYREVPKIRSQMFIPGQGITEFPPTYPGHLNPPPQR